MPMQMTLISKPRSFGGFGDGQARLEETTGRSDPMSNLQRMRWKPSALAEEPNEPELPDPCDSGKFIETDVPLRLISEVLEGNAERAVVLRGDRWAHRADG